MRTSQITRVTATGDVTTRDAYLKAVILAVGTADTTLTVRAGGASGAVILTLKSAGVATGATVVVPDLHDTYCADGVHATVAGAGAEATFVYA